MLFLENCIFPSDNCFVLISTNFFPELLNHIFKYHLNTIGENNNRSEIYNYHLFLNK